MSTIFGIKVPQVQKEIEVAYRHGIGNGQVQIDILNPLIFALPIDTPIITLNNTNQGIHTVGDIINHPNYIIRDHQQCYNASAVTHQAIESVSNFRNTQPEDL